MRLPSLSPSAHALRIDSVAVRSIHEWAKTQPNIRKYHSQGGVGLYGGAGLFNTAFVAPPLPSQAVFPDDEMDTDFLEGEMDMDMDGMEFGFGMGLGGLAMPPSYPGTSAGSSNWGGGVPMFPPSSSFSGHALRSGGKQQSAAATAALKPMDLLEEFDARMKKVREWTFGNTEAIHSE